MDQPETNTVFQTQFLQLVRRGRWEYVERRNTSGIVVIVAVTPENRLLLVEQYRPPVACRVIELPAGLAGDLAEAPDEPLERAAERELLEETGYLAANFEQLFAGPPSAGITSEVLTFFLARGITKVGDGGGDASEEIVVHAVPVADLPSWLREQAQAGKMVDVKVYAGLYALCQRHEFSKRSDS